MADIRRLEAEIKDELDKKIAAGEIGSAGIALLLVTWQLIILEPSVTPVESVKSNPF